MRGHIPITMPGMKGMWDRGSLDACPQDHFQAAQNVIFTERGVQTRSGIVREIVTPWQVRRYFTYKRTGEVDRLLILNDAAQLFDSTNLSAPILSVVGMVDFSMVVMFNRAYISPHNGVHGLAGEKIYVYQGGGPASPARPAGGTAPSAFTLGVTTGSSSGKIEAGKHLFAVAFESDSGFITQPGPDAWTLYDAPGARKVDISALPIGPAGTVARYILATKVITGTYTGNQRDYELFFIPNGKVNDNVSTAGANIIDFYDADLVRSAEYLLDQKSTIPAGVQLTNYNGCLVVCGNPSNEAVLEVAKSGDPESFSSIDGFVIVDPGDAGGGVLTTWNLRDILYIQKAHRTYATQNNGLVPSTWKVSQIDAGIGSSPFGVSRVLDSGGNTLDRVLVADRSGLLLFDGAFSDIPLTFKVDNTWKRITVSAFNEIQVVVDSVKKLIYIALPVLGVPTPNSILVGDYNSGLNAESIKWAYWVFPYPPQSLGITVDATTQEAYLKFAGRTGHIYRIDPAATDDNGVTLYSAVYCPFVKPAEDYSDCHFTGTRLRATGVGDLQITAYGPGRVRSVTAASIPLAADTGYPIERLFNLTAASCGLLLQCSTPASRFNIDQITVYGKQTRGSRASQ